MDDFIKISDYHNGCGTVENEDKPGEYKSFFDWIVWKKWFEKKKTKKCVREKAEQTAEEK